MTGHDRWYWIFRKYKLHEYEYKDLLEKQDYKCPVCNEYVDENNGVVDHNHLTGKVRGILHSGCNVALGHFKDSVSTLLRAIKYLLKNN